jgi:hypothetical protein
LALFVINEWLWADASGENGLEAQQDALRVVETLAASEHRVVLVEGSPFEMKAWALCRSPNVAVKGLVKAWFGSVRQSSDRCILIRRDEADALPEELARSLKPDDHYLVQSQRARTGAILVTTDQPLQRHVREAGLPCYSREEFLELLGLATRRR